MSEQPADDWTTEEQMRLMETSGALDFWNNPSEDIYNEDDEDEEQAV